MLFEYPLSFFNNSLNILIINAGIWPTFDELSLAPNQNAVNNS